MVYKSPPIQCQTSPDQDNDTYNANGYPEIIADNQPLHQEIPVVYENYIAYQSESTGPNAWNIWLYSILTETRRVITNSTGWQTNPDIYGNYIVYEDTRSGSYSDIYLYNLSNEEETAIVTDTYSQLWPRIYKNRVVYLSNQNTGNTSYDVYWYNINTGVKTAVTTTHTASYDFYGHSDDIYEDAVVWQDTRNGNLDIYWKNVSDSPFVPPKRLTTDSYNQSTPSIYMPYVLWKDNRNDNDDIYGCEFITPVTCTEFNLTTDTANQINPELHQDIAVWTDYRHPTTELYYYNLSLPHINATNGKRLTHNKDWDSVPVIYNDIVAYAKYNLTGWPEPNYDIYYLNMSQQDLCGDCDDMNASVNIGKTENVSLSNDSNICQNGKDDDCDGLIDCLDPSCDDSFPCAEFCIPSGPTETICNDHIDNDCDDLIDCDDPDCLNDLSCTGNATLHGFVFDETNWPIDIATVTGYPPFKPPITTFTDTNGFYNYTVPSGQYSFKADKFGYDPDIDTITGYPPIRLTFHSEKKSLALSKTNQ